MVLQKQKGMYSEPYGEPVERNSVIKHEKHLKKKSFKDIDHKLSGITTISRKQNTVKGILSNEKITILRQRIHPNCFPYFWDLHFP